MHAVVPAAGRGSRMGALTDDRPKPLIPIGGRPLLAHVFDTLATADPDRYVVVIGYRGEQIRDRFGECYRKRPIEYVNQPERLGLADAIRRAGTIVGENEFVALNGDNVLRTDLGRLTSSDAAVTLLAERCSRAAARETGVIVTDAEGQVERMVEKPDEPPSTLCSAGAFRASPAIQTACEAIEPSARGEYELADAITWLLERGNRADVVERSGPRVNVNTPADISRAADLLSD